MKKLHQGSTLLGWVLVTYFTMFTAKAMAEDWSKVETDAKKEGQLLVYSTTSRTAKAAEAFTKLTGINVEVVRLKEQELITRSYQEAQSGVHKVDMVVGEDWPAARELLNNSGYFVNYIPPTAKKLFFQKTSKPTGIRLHKSGVWL